MFISIKSEMDARPVIYPLMRCLINYGSVLVITNNRVMSRLVESQVDMGFRNITILVDPDDSADRICKSYGIEKDDYDYVIVDNVGSSESDVYILLASDYVTPEFDDEIEILVNESNLRVTVFQFNSGNKSKDRKRLSNEKEQVEEKSVDVTEENQNETPKERKERLKAERLKKEQEAREARKKAVEERKKEADAQRKARESGVIPDDYDPAEKFRQLTAGKSLRSKKSVVVPFPPISDLEKLEAEHIFAEVNPVMGDAFYDLLQDWLAVSKMDFQKEVRRHDESSGDLRKRETVR